MEIAPKQTLYIRNLNEKVHPNRMKEVLYTAFSRFGPVLDIICVRSDKLRGQAWIVYEDVSTASAAKAKLQGYSLCDKAITVEFAKNTSDAVLKIKNPKEYRERLRERREEMKKRKQMEDKRILEEGSAAPPAKKARTDESQSNKKQKPRAPTKAPPVSNEPPNKILFAQNLPADITLEKLEELFKNYNGYKEARLVPGHNVAFIEFEDEMLSSHAKAGLHNHPLADGVFLNLSFAKQ